MFNVPAITFYFMTVDEQVATHAPRPAALERMAAEAK